MKKQTNGHRVLMGEGDITSGMEVNCLAHSLPVHQTLNLSQ